MDMEKRRDLSFCRVCKELLSKVIHIKILNQVKPDFLICKKLRSNFLYFYYILYMFIFNIDRGGTFTDFYVQKVQHQTIVDQYCFKVPSQSSQGEGPIVGIKKFLQSASLIDKNESKIPTKLIKCINIGTTIATNALLERKGCKSLLIVSDGFDDLLQIRNQTRPNIFDLKCKRPEPLTKHVLTIDSRVYRSKIPILSGQLEELKQNTYHQKPSAQKLQQLLNKIKQIGPQSVGISLCNSYLTSHAQDKLAQYLINNGYKSIEKGSNYIDLGYLKRTETASLDCYLNPIMKSYFQKLQEQFKDSQNLKIRIMKSDGGFTNKQSIMSSQLLLSGPAGGLIGYSRLSEDLDKLFGLKASFLVGLDMGGTSTDISKVKNNQIDLKYSFEEQGIEICTPHLQIQTIAAGGGSKLGFYNGMLTVGPQSVGANPGPVCYGIGDQLAVTDANLLLNRLDVSFFPKVFGKDRNSPPDRELSMKAFERLAELINKDCQNKKTIYQLAEGYLQIANQLMAKSARKILTLGRPDALVIFGSAGGQHCCNIGQKIGVNHIIVHKFSGILSAYGLSKAYQTKETKVYIGIEVDSQGFNFLQLKKLLLQKFESSQEKTQQEADIVVQQVTIAYVGTSYSIKVPLNEEILKQFQKRHKQNNGFSLPNKVFKLEYYIKSFIRKPTSYQIKNQVAQLIDAQKFVIGTISVFLNGKFKQLTKYKLSGMKNCKIKGPALIFSQTSSILVQQNWNAHIVNQNIHLNRQKKQKITQNQNMQQIKQEQFSYKQCDPIKLTIYSTRLMGIAEQMGKVLQKTSISTNIKERLDFSCGIFDWNGHLLANAPHLPVHLGSMETAVVQQIKRGIKPGDVILSNHPAAGGSHLPDLTVISCFQIVKGLNFYVASRGHHADIGSITPGSMPPFSRTLSQQGVAIEKFQLVKNSEFLQKETRQLFKQSRRINDNISDLLAQISANQIGIKLLKILISQYGVLEFRRYVFYVCQNAKESVQQMLCKFSLNNNFPPVYSISNTQYMDDGTPLCLKLTIDRQNKSAVFDFTGTGPEVIGNTNAPKSITRSAVLYCLRSLLGKDIPLNSGCLVPIKFIIPQNSILYPSENCAVVGGNVQTSQKLVDLILKPFNQVACSQGTMNNFLFGNSRLSYYETICGGSGAGKGFCGTTTQCHMTNTRITDVQHLQRYYPVILTQFKKRPNSGGEGQFRGGDGAIREVMFLQQMEVSVLSQRRIFSPYGLEGGQNGKLGKNLLIKNNGIIKNIGSKNVFNVQKYDRVMINTPGGGGYGKS